MLHVYGTFDCEFDCVNNIWPNFNFMAIPVVQIADQSEHPPLSYGLFSKGIWRVFMFVYQNVYMASFDVSARVNP